MKLKHHIFRIVASLVTCGLFIFAIVKTESWFWLSVWCFVFLLICYVIIAIDEAHEYPVDYDEPKYYKDLKK